MAVFGVILAGGRGVRMGGVDKALLPLAGLPLLAHVAARFAPQVAALAISANGDAARFAGYGLPVLPDAGRVALPDAGRDGLPDAGRDGLPDLAAHDGPLAGVLAGMIWAEAQGGSALATVAVDTPFFPHDLVALLVPAGIAADAAGLHPTFAVWPVSLRVALAAALQIQERRVARFAAASGLRRVDFPGDGMFFNINTPQDLAKAAQRVAR